MKYEDLKWFEGNGDGRFCVTVRVQDAYSSDWDTNPIEFASDDHEEAKEVWNSIRSNGSDVVARVMEYGDYTEDDDVWCQLFLVDKEVETTDDVDSYYESYEVL